MFEINSPHSLSSVFKRNTEFGHIKTRGPENIHLMFPNFFQLEGPGIGIVCLLP